MSHLFIFLSLCAFLCAPQCASTSPAPSYPFLFTVGSTRVCSSSLTCALFTSEFGFNPPMPLLSSNCSIPVNGGRQTPCSDEWAGGASSDVLLVGTGSSSYTLSVIQQWTKSNYSNSSLPSSISSSLLFQAFCLPGRELYGILFHMQSVRSEGK